jgi:hypothetical protein
MQEMKEVKSSDGLSPAVEITEILTAGGIRIFSCCMVQPSTRKEYFHRW